MDKVSILNLDIHSIYLNDLLKDFTNGILFTPNVDHLIKLQKDIEFYNIYKSADRIICDSNILNLASKFLGNPIAETIPGSSFFPSFYQYHKNNKNIKIFLLGAAPGIAKMAMLKINSKVGREMVVGEFSPSFGFENNKDECQLIIDLINKSNSNVLVVGLGAPKQEKWIFENKHFLKSINIFMALGATLDFEAGNIPRAPVIVRKLYLEWLFRFLLEPKRLWKRYFVDDLPFLYLILKQKLGIYSNPFP